MVPRVHNIYTERECPTLHMLCTNTLRKVMTQQPLTAKVLIKLKPYTRHLYALVMCWSECALIEA